MLSNVASSLKKEVNKMRYIIFFYFLLNTVNAEESFKKNCTDEYNSSRPKTRKLLREIYSKTVYCDCDWIKNSTRIKLQECGIKPESVANSLRNIQLEHVVPKSWLYEIESKDPKACSDPINLYPTVGKANNKRRNYKYGIISGEDYFLGNCDFEVKNKIAEPKEVIRGDIARIHFYMSLKYGFKLEKDYLSLLTKWNKADPVSKEECKRNKKLKNLFGKENIFVTINCL